MGSREVTEDLEINMSLKTVGDTTSVLNALESY
jgi:hypothetical protein